MSEHTDIPRSSTQLGSLAGPLLIGGALVGAAGLAISIVLAMTSDEAATRFHHAYLTNYMFFLSLALGGLFLVLLDHLARSGWSVVIRRLEEGLAANAVLMAVLFIPLLLGMDRLYLWMTPEKIESEHLRHLIEYKEPYLNTTFFLVRAALYFAIWVGLAWYYVSRSRRQDDSGDVALTRRMEKFAPLAMILFGLTTSFAAWDWIMSRDPSWYSTIFGAYYFSGTVLGGFCLTTIMAALLQGTGRLRESITPEHYQDLGKYTFGFVVFWAYIAFSQYMLIWYGNIPEETQWYHRRQWNFTGIEGLEWGHLSALLVLGHFVVPFLLIISRRPKRRARQLALVSAWLLLMHWVDVYWLVMPEYGMPEYGYVEPGLANRVPLSWMDLFTFLGIGGLFVAGTSLYLRDKPLVPVRDPRIMESLTFENA